MKKIIKGLLASLLLVSMAACANDTTTSDETSQPETETEDTMFTVEEGTEITMWHTFTDDQEATLEEIAKEFNETNEYGITVNIESQAYQGFRDTVKQNVYNGQGPDLILDYPSTAAEYVEDELVLDLGQYIEDETYGIAGYAESLPSGIYEESKSFDDGLQHVVITQTTGPVHFYNKTLYDELNLTPATTWDELVANAKTIKEEKGLVGLGFDSLTDTLQALILQNDGGYIDLDTKTVLWNDEIGANAINYIADNTKSGYFALTPTNNYFSSDFNAGSIGGFIGSVAGLPYVDTADQFEFAIAAMPAIGNEWTPAWDRGLIAFDHDDSSKAMADYLFIKFFIEQENNLKWVQSYNSLSPYFAVTEEADYQAYVESNIALKALSETIETAGALPSVTGATTVRNELTDAAKAVAADTATTEEALAEAAENSNDALQGN